MSSLLSPFGQRVPYPRTEIPRQFPAEAQSPGEMDDQETIPYPNSKLTHDQHNEIFEGDCWSFEGQATLNLRTKTFISGSDDPEKFDAVSAEADKGLLGTSLGAQRSHVHFALGRGADIVSYTGNSARNIALLEMDEGYKKVDFDLSGGDDRAVLFLNDCTGIIHIDGGQGYDVLEVHTPKSGTNFEIRHDNLIKTEDPNTRLLIQAPCIERVVHFRDGQLVSETESG